MEHDLRLLDSSEIDSVSGGFVCGGWCVAAIGVTFISGAVAGYAVTKAALD